MARRRFAPALTFVLFALARLSLWPSMAEAEGSVPDPSQELQLLESTERALDPLGIDDSTGKALDEAAQALTRAREKAAREPKPKNIVAGAVLSALDAVSESAHEVKVQLSQGLALVRVVMRFESRSEEPAELAYRLPLPADAATFRVRVCRAKSCRDALPQQQPRDTTNSSEPFVWANPIRDARGDALSVRAGPVQKSAPLELTVEYVAEAPIHGGSARFRLPARGHDDRVAQAQLTVGAELGLRASPAQPVMWDAWQSFEVYAQFGDKSPHTLSSLQACGGRGCVREWSAAAPAPAGPRDTWLVLDASPSMQGDARNAADLVLTALLAALPAESPLRLVAFGSRAQELGRFANAQLAPLKLLSDALMTDLGAASRPGSALKLARHELQRGRPLVLIVSDAKWDEAALRELREAKTAQSELWLLQVGRVPPTDRRAFEGVIDLTDLALALTTPERNEERLRAPFSRLIRKGLRAGEQLVRMRGQPSTTARADDGALAFWLARERPGFATSARPVSMIAAPPFESSPAAPAPVATSMPKESVLTMLRTQLIPEARGCLRTDRKGRANYAVALTFRALFAEREAYDVDIEGKIPAPLEKCLLDVVGRLRIPAFNGRIAVRYPIHTEREPEPPVIELLPEARDSVDRVIRGQ